MSAPVYSNLPSTHAVRWRIREVLMKSPALLHYLRMVYALDQGNYPFYTYVGVNFTRRAVKNYKFYFSFYRRLTEPEIDALLPVPDRGQFDRFYREWQPTLEAKTLHRGVTFAVKVEADASLTHYYHLRTRGMPFGPPTRFAIPAHERDAFHGVCEEFRGEKISLKKYFYSRDAATIEESLRAASMPDGRYDVPFLEYIESDERDKFTWVTHDPELIQAHLSTRGPAALGPSLARLCEDCDYTAYSPGSARDGGDHSIYFYPFAMLHRYDGVRAFAEKYLRLVLA